MTPALPATAHATAPAAPTEDKSLRVTRKVRDAVHAMVWDGLPRRRAAEKAGISEHGLYKALRKPPVKALYLQELEVLRTSERARNIHVLCEVRDQTGNQMARVNAVKALEQVDDDVERKAAVRTPGVVIQIVNQAQSADKSLELQPSVGYRNSQRVIALDPSEADR